MILINATQATVEVLKEMQKEITSLNYAIQNKKLLDSLLPIIYTLLGAGVTFFIQYYFHKVNSKNKLKEDISKLYSAFATLATTANIHFYELLGVYVNKELSNFRLEYYKDILQSPITYPTKHLTTIESEKKEIHYNKLCIKEEAEKLKIFDESRERCFTHLYELKFRLRDSELEKLISKYSEKISTSSITFNGLDKSKIEDKEYLQNYYEPLILVAVVDAYELMRNIMKRIEILT